MSRSLGIPVKLLHEASGHIVTVELKSGELYRGSMLECEDNWNCQLENITYTAKVPCHIARSLISYLRVSVTRLV
ncbi:Small nuclear ribonucleoprotein SmD3b [Linum perenne]